MSITDDESPFGSVPDAWHVYGWTAEDDTNGWTQAEAHRLTTGAPARIPDFTDATDRAWDHSASTAADRAPEQDDAATDLHDDFTSPEDWDDADRAPEQDDAATDLHDDFTSPEDWDDADLYIIEGEDDDPAPASSRTARFAPKREAKVELQDRDKAVLLWLTRVDYATNAQVQRRFWPGPVDRRTSGRVLSKRLRPLGYVEAREANGIKVWVPTRKGYTHATEVHPTRVATRARTGEIGSGRVGHTLGLADLAVHVHTNPQWWEAHGVPRPGIVTEREIEVVDPLTPSMSPVQQREWAKTVAAARKAGQPKPKRPLTPQQLLQFCHHKIDGSGIAQPDMIVYTTLDPRVRVAVEFEESRKSPSPSGNGKTDYDTILKGYLREVHAGRLRGVLYFSTDPKVVALVGAAIPRVEKSQPHPAPAGWAKAYLWTPAHNTWPGTALTAPQTVAPRRPRKPQTPPPLPPAAHSVPWVWHSDKPTRGSA